MLFSPLKPWLERQLPLSPFLEINDLRSNVDISKGWLGLEAVCPLHNAREIPAQSLAASWTATNAYVQRAGQIIDGLGGGWLDGEEVEMIRGELGEPPPACFPIYIISISNPTEEKVAYIGKTSSNKGRFRGGHAAAIKLHAPEYEGFKKQVYQGYIMLYSNDEYLPLEWVHPLEAALAILDSVESQLIFEFQPPLNEQKIKSYQAKLDFEIHIQNFTGSTFLNDEFIFPPRFYTE